ncbi:hypothetical protein FGG08_007341 [Glutinoglossum americanum]|uniref:Heterokaryon incompatibility domain-containing protein n=1 Tax=Glutinoglossum americanum TaxID=1670608 RepID=A0A9P8HWI5_9PEZI|nr:hypothetical protein FGG08_007341 [Glutinoglossum americanum]
MHVKLYDSASGTRIRLGFQDEAVSSVFELFTPEGDSMVGREEGAVLDPRPMYGFKIAGLRPFRVPMINKAPRISENTSSSRALRWTREMLQKCALDHRECLHRYEDALLPTMVLDLGTSAPALEQDLKLYRSQAESAPYVCLSHCWGGSGWMKTTTLNIKEHLNEIAFKSLPRTFRDAVTFTRGLRIRYLWIDSLCIVQDDLEDWRRESGNMCTIYHGSSLTLAASMASNNDGGCFYSHASMNERGHKLKIDHPEYEQSEIYLRECIDHDIVIKAAPLLSRAWVYQERLLSPRYLHFGNAELVWECAEGISCECGFCECQGGRMTYANTLHANKLPLGPRGSVSVRPSSAVRLRRWHKLVSDYSALALTYPSDRLPAISGLAKHSLEPQGAEYLAGLWEDGLPLDLLWYTAHPSRRSQEWRAPTWSWASIDSPIGFISMRKDDASNHCAIIQAECTPLGPDSFGEVSSGCITLSGHLVPAILRASPLRTDEAREREQEVKPNLEIPSPCHVIETHFDWLWPAEQACTPYQPVHYLAIASNSMIQYGLVLSCVDATTKAFERIGIATVRKSGMLLQGEPTELRIV